MAWLCYKHAGRYMEVSPDYVRRLVGEGKLRAYRPKDQAAPRWKVSTDDMDALIRREWECSESNAPCDAATSQGAIREARKAARTQ